MEKDEIGFDLALISKFVTKKKSLRSTKKIFATLVRALNSFDY
jgi:hypothetical protein